VALRHLAELERGIHRVVEAGDKDAFHLVHSGLAGLGAALREFGPWLGQAERNRAKLSAFYRREGRLAALGADLERLETLLATEGADAEELEWAVVGFRWRRERLTEDFSRDLQKRLLPELAGLRDGLSHAGVTVSEEGLAEGPTGGLRVLGRAWQLQERLGRLLGAALERPGGRATLRASAHTRRLLFLLGPLGGEGHREARRALDDISELDRLLGDLHSQARLRNRLRELLVTGASREVKGWRSRERQEALHPIFAALDRSERELCAEIRKDNEAGRWSRAIRIDPRAGEELPGSDPGGGPASDPGLERRFLLRALPALPPDAEPIRIVQGWIPDDPWLARLRSVERMEGPPRRTRVVRLPSGPGGGPGTEAEDEPPDPVFEALWPLTEGCRLRKLRWRLGEEEAVWAVDSIPALRVLVARLTPSREGAGAGEALPAWLAPVVIREITGEAGWTDEELAVRGHPEGGPPPPGPGPGAERPGRP
jgi:hypothetical protein